MNLEKQTIRFKVRKIIVRNQMVGPVLYDFYLSVLTHKPGRKSKETAVLSPTVCFTKGHLVPTEDGFKPVNSMKVGDTMLAEIPLLSKS